MLDNYLIVHKSILPDYFEKVLHTRRLLEGGEAKDVSQAVKMAGISRSTYYKYKDYIMEPSEMSEGRRAVISLMLNHAPGVLSALLSRISDAGGSVLTISQSLPVHDRAEVLISLDVAGMNMTMDNLMKEIAKTQGVEKYKLLAIE
jgi:ACT domain-containing protein